MPTRRTTKPHSELAVKELQEIKFLLRSILEEEQKEDQEEEKKKWYYTASEHIGVGILRGLGMVIGATIVAGILLLAVQNFLASLNIEAELTNLLNEAVIEQTE